MTYLKTLFVLGSVTVLAACGSKKATISTTETKPESAKTVAALSASESSMAKQIFETKCTKCHPAKDPTLYSEAQLNKIVPNMVSMVNKEETLITDSQKDVLLRYLVQKSKE